MPTYRIHTSDPTWPRDGEEYPSHGVALIVLCAAEGFHAVDCEEVRVDDTDRDGRERRCWYVYPSQEAADVDLGSPCSSTPRIVEVLPAIDADDD